MLPYLLITLAAAFGAAIVALVGHVLNTLLAVLTDAPVLVLKVRR